MAFAARLTRLTSSVAKVCFISSSACRHGKLVPYKLTDIGEGIREVTVKEWYVKPGDKVRQFDNICEVQSDKASVTITSRYDGVIKNLNFKIDDTALVGSALLDIEMDGEEPASTKKIEEEITEILKERENVADTSSDSSSDEERDEKAGRANILTTPAVRRIAKENHIDLAEVKASGKDNRILKEDVLAYLQTRNQKKTPPEPTVTHEAAADSLQQAPKKMYQKHMWKTMTKALEIPQFLYSDELEVSKLIALRNEIKDDFKALGINLTYMPFFLKAISQALLKYPELNAWIDENREGSKIIKEHNIGVAMDTPGGLIVPNVKSVQNLSITEIAKELNRIQECGKKCALSSRDLAEGTFSFSNIGIVGGTYTGPVILSPQVAIGAIGRIQKVPRFDQKENVFAANVLTVSWSADHRVVDGVTLAKFSNTWKRLIENPYQLIFNL